MPVSWRLEQRKISDLKDYPKNPRKLTKEQYENLKNSLEKYGLIDKPIINLDNTLIGGHQRKNTIKKLGYKTVDCWIPDRQLDEKEIEELNIRLNKNTGEWDWDILGNQFEISDLLEWGFTADELVGAVEEIETIESEDEDETLEPAKDEDATTKLGDVYELNDHKIICGSSTEHGVYDKIAKDLLFDLIITDPPYNVDYTGKTKDALKIQNDSMSDNKFYSFLYDAYVNMYLHIKDGSPIYVFHADMEGVNFRKAFKDSGFKLSQCLVWKKNSLVMGRQDYHWQHEPILYGWKEGESHKWYSDRSQTTVLEFDRPSRSSEHPTMKPVEIISYLINNSSQKNDLILDPFLGSGTTLIAAEQLKRICYGIELSPAYCDIIVQRWANYMTKNSKPFTIKRNQIDVTQEYVKT